MLRWLLVLVAVVIALAGAAIAALHTDWGREQLRRRIEAALDQRFVGDVRIGRLEGSVFGELTLRDVEIDDAEGQPAIRVAALRGDLALRPLLDHEARFHWLVAEGLQVDGRRQADGTLDLSHLLVPSEEPRGWDVTVEDLQIPDARVTITGGAQDPLHVDDLDVTGSLSAPRTGPLEATVNGTGAWRERGVVARLDAELRQEEQTTHIARLDAGLGELQVHAREVSIIGDQIAGDASIDLPEAAVRALLPDLPVHASLTVQARALPLDGGGTRFELTGRATGPGLDASLTGALVRVRDIVTSDGLRLVARVDDLGAVVETDPPLRGALSADVTASGRLAGGEVAGPDLALAGAVRGRGLRVREWSARTLAARIDARGLPRDPAGRADIDLGGVARAGRPIGRLVVNAASRTDGAIAVSAISWPPYARWRIDVDALVRVDQGRALRIALGEHRVRTFGVDWSGRGGRIAIDGGTNGGIAVHGWDRSAIRVVAKLQAQARRQSDAEA
ncbi:MAG TPA: hypothetical protein VL172_14750, partial [Kofleriaceae bacterium]|nr:hypothetical protein [Kofleriaceae bacterium]